MKKLIIFCIIILLFTKILQAERDTHFAISDSVYINTIIPFDSLRIVPIVFAPNPAVLNIPEGGYGYAWFMVEGFEEEEWFPLPDIEIISEDEQGNEINCKSNELPLQFLTEPYYTENAGVFGIPIPADLIGNGSPGAQETITVTTVDDSILAIEAQQSIDVQVVPYSYKASWGYRIYKKGGLGLTGGIVTAIGFAGGGSGAKIELVLEGTSTTPAWSNFKIFRRDDIFVGAKVALGPPKLLNVGLGAEASVTASFPYQHEFEFDMNSLDGLEAVMAYYLFAEPVLLYFPGPIPGGEITVKFLSVIVALLIENSAQNGLGIARLSDEVGLDIEGNINFGVELIEGLPLNMTVGASLGANCHLGGTRKIGENGMVNHKLYVSGGYQGALGIGPKIIPAKDSECKFIYPSRLRQIPIPTSLEVKYELFDTWYPFWQSTKLTTSLATNASQLNYYNLPGQIQEYKSWFSTDNMIVRNFLFSVTELPSMLETIGEGSLDVAVNNESFGQDYTNFLNTIFEHQNNDVPIKLKYGLDAEDKSEYAMDVETQFPLPIFPNIVINLGGGIKATNAREYELAKGYWVKGIPCLQTEMMNPPYPAVTFLEVIEELWDHIVNGNIYSELADVILNQIRHTFFSWWGDRSIQTVDLNETGSILTIVENSIPADLDSVLCRFWEWEEESENQTLTASQREKLKDYITSLRATREEALGMRYGIGGFFKFEPDGYTFQDTTVITIAYADSEVVDIDESTLAVYWQDEFGEWNMISSEAVPDSNFVRAEISGFTTYTLAPRLPQGSFSLYSNPDSLAADGISTAQITSESLFNNDNTMIEDGTLFTVETTRGEIVTADEDTTDFGVQVAVSSGIIQFEVQSDSVALPIHLSAASVNGFATCDTTLDLFDVSLPDTPVLLAVEQEHGAIHLTWEEVNNPDLAGYHIWFDTDQSGAPYDGSTNFEGEPSPVSVGLISDYTLTGLSDSESYFVAVSAFDISGSESGYSNEMSISPELQRVEVISAAYDVEGVRISWEPVFGATSYRIFRSTDAYANINEMDLVAEVTSTTWIDQDALFSEKYFYKIVVVAY